jgi:membrane-associated phospholipid phosphatase
LLPSGATVTTGVAPGSNTCQTPFARALDALHLVGISFFLAASLAAVARGDPSAGAGVALYAVLLAATLALVARVHRPDPPSRAAANLHLGWTIVVLPAVFAGMRFVAPASTEGRNFDDALDRIDREWLGVDVARWSEGFLTAPMADVSMAFYFLYFAMPIVVLAAHARSGDRARTYRVAFAIAAGAYACYMLYLLVPAAGPRHAYVGRSEPLPRGWITGALHDFIRDLEPQPWDAFPSAHVVLGLLCAWACLPFRGWLAWTMAVVGVGTAVSTVVLRYHYLVDDLAALAVFGAALASTFLLDARIARKAAAAASASPDRMEELLGRTG